MTALVEIPVEDVFVGQRIQVGRRVGLRRVVDVLAYDTLGVEEVRCFVVVYDPAGPGQTWENRSGMKGVSSSSRRETASLRPFRLGELVRVERLHLVEGS
jgi:hypothetical protein